jgi:phasin family protein
MNSPAVEYVGSVEQATAGSIAGIAQRTLDGFRRLAHLNLETAQTALSEQREIAEEAVTSRSLDWLLLLPPAQIEAAMKKSLAYWRDASDIAIETVADSVGSSLCGFSEYARWTTSLLGDAMSRIPASESTSLVIVDPDANLPLIADVEDADAKAGRRRRSVKPGDEEGGDGSTMKQ